MKTYFALVRGGDNHIAQMSETEKAAHMEAWGTFMGGLAATGNLEGGLPLSAEGRVLSDHAKTVKGEAFADGKVGGYLMIKATTLDEATELCKTCPVFESTDGSIEVREALPM